MEIQELKSYLKACIDAYQTTEEIPRIIESIGVKIREIDLTKEEFPLMPAEKKTKVFKGSSYVGFFVKYFVKNITQKDVIPNKYKHIYLNGYNGKREAFNHSQKEFSPHMGYNKYLATYEEQLAHDIEGNVKDIKLEGSNVYFYNSSSSSSPNRIISFPFGYKRTLKLIWQKSHDQAEAKLKENETMADVYKERYIKEAEDYKIKAKEYNDAQLKKQRQEDERIEREKIKLALMQQESDAFANNLEITKNSLIKLLDINVLHPKYRSYACVCSLYDYIDTGICTELTGPFGAYQRYEEDYKAGLIIDSLGRIEDKLDQVISNQATLANAIESSALRISRAIENVEECINNSLVRIESNQHSIKEDLAEVGSGITETNKWLAENSRILEGYGKDSAATRYSVERIARLQEYVNSVKFANGEFNGFEYRYPF